MPVGSRLGPGFRVMVRVRVKVKVRESPWSRSGPRGRDGLVAGRWRRAPHAARRACPVPLAPAPAIGPLRAIMARHPPTCAETVLLEGLAQPAHVKPARPGLSASVGHPVLDARRHRRTAPLDAAHLRVRAAPPSLNSSLNSSEFVPTASQPHFGRARRPPGAATRVLRSGPGGAVRPRSRAKTRRGSQTLGSQRREPEAGNQRGGPEGETRGGDQKGGPERETRRGSQEQPR